MIRVRQQQVRSIRGIEHLKHLDELLESAPVARVLRDGVRVVIAGPVNAGKSSLFNRLLGESRAIVTDVPGTTRDAIEAFVESESWPLRLVDTAGLRETSDTVERIGIEVSERYLTRADVVLACGDSAESLSAVTDALYGKTEAPIIAVRTKSDIPDQEKIRSSVIRVSAETGTGLKELLTEIDHLLSVEAGPLRPDIPVLTKSRQIFAIQRARDETKAFGNAWRDRHLPAPVAAVHLRSAAGALEELIGAVSTDDVLDRVFSSFCVGK